MYVWPFFIHSGANLTEPVFCNCSQSYGKSYQCNQFNFLIGMIFYNDLDGLTSQSSLTTLAASGDALDLMHKSFNPSFAAVNEFEKKHDPVWRKNAYEFCNQGRVNCSMLTINAFDLTGLYLSTVTDNNYQLTNGSCVESFRISEEAQDRLASTPPAELKEIYYTCTTKEQDALISALGISLSYIMAARSGVIVALGVLFILWRRKQGPNVPRAYSSNEKEAILEYFALNLLLSRDGHLNSIDHGIITQMRQELQSSKELSKYYIRKPVSSSSDENDDYPKVPAEYEKEKIMNPFTS